MDEQKQTPQTVESSAPTPMTPTTGEIRQQADPPTGVMPREGRSPERPDSPMFKLAEEEPIFGAKIKVIGVGGCGCNAVKNMFQSHVRGVELIAANTDAQHLEKRAKADKKIQLGPGSTRGLGAGGDPERGRTAAQESREEIRKVLEGADMAFITAGMGGGTGTGAAPMVAQIAKEMGILTVGVVTRPLADEGPRRQKHAEEGLREMRNYTDTIIVIPNQRLLAVAGDRDLREAFRKADDVLINAVRGISDIITVPGLVNRDFADIKSVMQEMGLAMMGIGLAQGENRAKEAAEFAISSPLLEDVSIQGAKAILVNFTGYSMTLNEVHQAIDYIRQQAGDQAHLLWGAVYNKNKKFKDTLRVTVIATGFGSTKREETTARAGNARDLGDYDSPTWLRRKRQEKPEAVEKEFESTPPAPQQAAGTTLGPNDGSTRRPRSGAEGASATASKSAAAFQGRSAAARAQESAGGYGGVTIHERSRVETTDEDYDIPTFLRRRPD